jgi:hypothetical protein
MKRSIDSIFCVCLQFMVPFSGSISHDHDSEYFL